MNLDYYEIDLDNGSYNLNQLAHLPEIIDIHTHIFPKHIAARAVDSIGSFYSLKMTGIGTSEALIEAADRARVAKSVVFSTATVKSQVDAINIFLAEQQNLNHEKFIAFGTLHPQQSAIEINETLASLKALHLKGIKLHPDFQQTAADSDFVLELAAQAGSEFPLMIHAGDWRYDFSGPARIARLAALRPDSRIIAAHFGGWSQWQDAAHLLENQYNVMVDTSSSLAFMPPAEATELIYKFGCHRVMFGSDFPMWQPYEEMVRLCSLELKPSELEKIFYYNAAEVLANSLRSSST